VTAPSAAREPSKRRARPAPGSKNAGPKPAGTKPKTAAKANTAPEPRTGGLTAAHRVLAGTKQPMRVKELAKAVIDKGLWSPEGKTPSATLAAAIGREIKLKGKHARFKKTGPGLFTAARA
jgi:hypothetical protein